MGCGVSLPLRSFDLASTLQLDGTTTLALPLGALPPGSREADSCEWVLSCVAQFCEPPGFGRDALIAQCNPCPYALDLVEAAAAVEWLSLAARGEAWGELWRAAHPCLAFAAVGGGPTATPPSGAAFPICAYSALCTAGDSPLAYSFTLASGVTPTSWELQGTRGEGGGAAPLLWHTLDTRKFGGGSGGTAKRPPPRALGGLSPPQLPGLRLHALPPGAQGCGGINWRPQQGVRLPRGNCRVGHLGHSQQQQQQQQKHHHQHHHTTAPFMRCTLLDSCPQRGLRG